MAEPGDTRRSSRRPKRRLTKQQRILLVCTPPFMAGVVLIRCGPWWALGELIGSASLWWLLVARPGTFTVERAARHMKATFALLSFWLATEVFAPVALLTPMSRGRWTPWEVLASVLVGVGVTALLWPMQRAYYGAAPPGARPTGDV